VPRRDVGGDGGGGNGGDDGGGNGGGGNGGGDTCGGDNGGGDGGGGDGCGDGDGGGGNGNGGASQDVDDLAEFGKLCAALETMGVPVAQRQELWRVLSAVLALGNVTFAEVNDTVRAWSVVAACVECLVA
jgi:hypothetical protein